MKNSLFTTAIIVQFVFLFGQTILANSSVDRNRIKSFNKSFSLNSTYISPNSTKSFPVKELGASSNRNNDHIEANEFTIIPTISEISSFNPELYKTPISTPLSDSLAINFTTVPAYGGKISGDNFIFDSISGTGAGNFADNNGIKKSFIAIPYSGFKLSYWSFDAANDTVKDTHGNPILGWFHPRDVVTASKNNLYAHFNYIVNATPNISGGGTITGTGNFASGTGDYTPGSTAILTATPLPGYEFVNWSEGSVTISNSLVLNLIVNNTRTLVANFQLITYNITITSNPVGGGSTSGSGSYSQGATANLNATPAYGYAFVNWTDGATIVSTSPGFSVTVDKDKTFTANFIQQFLITVVALPSSGGSTTPSGSDFYDVGTIIPLMATPAAGYRFVNWIELNIEVSTSPSFSVIANKDRTLRANFIKQFTIITSSMPVIGGSVTGSGTFDINSPVTLTASPSVGFVFVNWTEGGIFLSSNSSLSFTATNNRNIQANFIQKFTIIANALSGGTVLGSGIYDSGTPVTLTSSPTSGYAFINWTEDGTVISTNSAYAFTADKDRTLLANFIQRFNITANASLGGSATGSGIYDNRSSVSLNATPSAGYAFVNWTEDESVVSISSAYSFSADKNRTLQANFIQRFNITASSTAGGSASGSEIYDNGSSVTLNTIPSAGYAFVNWTEGGSVVSTSSAYSFSADKDRTLQANFIQRFNITAISTAGGSASGSGIYDNGSSVALNATSSAGYTFVNWTEGETIFSTSSTYSFTADKDRTLQANFIQRFNITANASSGGSATGTGIYDSETSITLNATPSAGYAFVNWTEGETVVSTSSAYSFMADKDRTLLANFIQRFNITANATLGGSATGSGIYDNGSSVTLTSTPASGYVFVNWTEGGTVVSTSSAYSFMADRDRTLQANFIQRFNITANASFGGSASGSGIYDNGSSVSLNATPLTGYAFVNWTEGGTIVSTSSAYSFTADKDRTLLANFIQRFNITANASLGGSATGSGIYDNGSSVSLNATPLTGYAFVNWTEGETIVSTSSTYSFMADRDRTLQANFIQRFNITANATLGGSATGSGIYDSGNSVALNATPSAGFTFVNWTEGETVVSTISAYSFMADHDRTLQANFIQRFNITANATLGGSASGSGIYDNGSSVALTSNPASGYVFVNWTEGGTVVSTSSVYSFMVDRDRTLLANFIQRFNITANASSGGSATGSEIYDSGTPVTLTSNPASGYAFVNWTEGETVVSTSSTYSFMADRDRTLLANFIQRFNITANASLGGSASGTGIYDNGSSVALNATALTGYTFINWTESEMVVSTNTSFSITADKDRTLLANFIQRFNITANASSGGSATGSGIYDSGTPVALNATPSAGFTFVNWTEGETVVSTSSAYNFTADKDRTLQATFKLNTFTINATVLPLEGGTISDGINNATSIYNKVFSFGDNIKLSALPAQGYDFINWTEDGTYLNITTPDYSFVVNNNRDIKANYIKKKYTITATSNPSEGGTISIVGTGSISTSISATYTLGNEVKLSAINTPCFVFDSWTEDNIVVSLSANYTFTTNGNRTLQANFKAFSKLTVKASDSICMGTGLDFSTLSDKPNTNLIWDFGDGTTMVTGSDVKHIYTATGFFKVIVKSSDASFCPGTAYKIITVYNPLSKFNFKDTIGCSPFHFSKTLSSKEKLLWNFGDDNSWYSKGDKIYVNTSDKPARRKVTVVSDDSKGCNSPYSFNVTINPSPKSGIEFYTKPGRPETLVYKNISILSDSCEWELPDGTFQINKDSIIQQYKQNGLYRILLKSSNKYGCTDTTSISHRTILTGLYVPNAFRPESQDHKVNCFKPIGTGIKTLQMGIYDLWGNLIWQTKTEGDLESFEGWNGKSINGTPLPVGVYIWRIKATFQDGTEWKGTPDEKGKCRTEGNITILR